MAADTTHGGTVAAHLRTLIILSSGSINSPTGIDPLIPGEVITQHHNRVVVIPEEGRLLRMSTMEEFLDIIAPHMVSLAKISGNKPLIRYLSEEVSGFVILIPKGHSEAGRILTQVYPYPKKIVIQAESGWWNPGNARVLIVDFLENGTLKLDQVYHIPFPGETGVMKGNTERAS